MGCRCSQRSRHPLSTLLDPACYNIYYRYFHGFSDLISSHKDDPSFTIQLPGLPSLRIQNLPDLLTLSSDGNGLHMTLLAAMKESFDKDGMIGTESHGSKPTVLVNTFDTLEHGALSAVEEVEMLAVGPMVDVSLHEKGNDLVEQDSKRYMEWLDTKPVGSLVYVAFGSFSNISKKQVDELIVVLEKSRRPYLYVIREDSGSRGGGETGMVVNWCSQMKGLSHPSIGYFVTHCGWNSTIKRVLGGKKLRRCVDLLIGEDGMEMRKTATMWREKAVEAMGEGGS